MPTTPLYDDEALLRLIADGDEKAFGLLVDRYSDLLATHIHRVTNSHELTQEIVQDVFLKIWMTRESLPEVRNIRAYLHVLSRNRALNALKARVREQARKLKWERSLVAGVADEEEEQQEQLSLLDQAIAQLPPQQQKVWILSRREQMKYREIAEAMDLSQETVKKYLQIASLSITKYIETHIGIALIGILAEQNF